MPLPKAEPFQQLYQQIDRQPNAGRCSTTYYTQAIDLAGFFKAAKAVLQENTVFSESKSLPRNDNLMHTCA